jgi:hypothetical protein
VAEQSGSVVAVQPVGQQPSLWDAQAAIGVGTQRAEQSSALPTRIICKQGDGEGGHEVGQAWASLAWLSHVSPGSIKPSPQLAGQSVSVARVAPAGQHPSPEISAVICRWTQAASQATPVSKSVVQALPSSQVLGQLPSPGGEIPTSQASPASRTPSPQATGQSVSTALKPPGGQQPSPEICPVIW